MHELKIKLLVPDILPPSYSHDGDAGLDLRASGHWIINLDTEEKEIHEETLTIQPGERAVVKTGIALAIPPGHWGNVRDRSGLARKNGIRTLAGVVDENYRGELNIVLINQGTMPYTMKKNERLAQLIITPYTRPNLIIADNLDDTNRGTGGFGHSGKF